MERNTSNQPLTEESIGFRDENGVIWIKSRLHHFDIPSQPLVGDIDWDAVVSEKPETSLKTEKPVLPGVVSGEGEFSNFTFSVSSEKTPARIIGEFLESVDWSNTSKTNQR